MSESPKPAGTKRKQRKPNLRSAPAQQGSPSAAASGAGSELERCELYINRELSLLEFQFRVLEEAEDERNPLLERVKFLAILGSNLDEFFMVRVAGLKQQIAAGVFEPSADGMTPSEQLAAVRKAATRLMTGAYSCLSNKLLPALSAASIHILDWKALTKRQQQTVKRYFDDVVFPVLTPLAHDPGRPFPHISNLSLNLAVLLRGADGETRFARIKVPDTLPRLVPVKRSSGGTRKDGTVPQDHYFVWLEQVIAANLDTLFPGVTILDAHPFRVTRNADIDIQDLEAADLLETIEESLQRRKFGTVVRLATERGMPGEMREVLFENLEVDRKDVYLLDGPLGLSALFQVAAIPLPNLKDRPYVPVLPPALEDSERDGDLFAPIRREDILLHHPFDSFAPVVDFLRRSSRDKDVLAIKMTLYRVGRNSPVVESLLEANENHKQVAVLVELKARFDEESNIEWARALEAEGVHVVYGLLGLKTHSKVAMVVRREGESIRRYVHLATGNYNPVTAQLYTDIGMFTTDEAIGADATDLFNFLTGYSAKTTFRKLLVAPINLRSRLVELIRREIEHQRAGRRGHIIFKVNALVDKELIRLLYEASQAGVRTDLLVRGICCLRPGVPGVSESITVTSIVGRFLEHSRILYFANGGEEDVFVGSADLMPRNIDRRVEVLFPVSSPRLIRHLRDDILGAYLADNMRARRMQPDGTYVRLKPGPGEPAIDSQLVLMRARPAE